MTNAITFAANQKVTLHHPKEGDFPVVFLETWLDNHARVQEDGKDFRRIVPLSWLEATPPAPAGDSPAEVGDTPSTGVPTLLKREGTVHEREGTVHEREGTRAWTCPRCQTVVPVPEGKRTNQVTGAHNARCPAAWPRGVRRLARVFRWSGCGVPGL